MKLIFSSLFLYSDAMLFVEEKALDFDTRFRDERCTLLSPLNSHVISSNVIQVSRSTTENLRRIKYEDYIPTDSDSPQGTLSQISSSCVSANTEEFEYQRIEKKEAFGYKGKAEKAHLISKEHCDRYESYKRYKKDPNNILALSHTMHGYFDALDRDLPLFKLDIERVEPKQVVNGRPKVMLLPPPEVVHSC